MRSIMRSRSWGSLVPPTDHGPAPWPRSTIDLYHDISTIDLMRSLGGMVPLGIVFIWTSAVSA